MTRATIFTLLFLSLHYSIRAQLPDTTTGFFDNDALEDTLYYHYENDSVDGPTYRLNIVCGSGRAYDFAIGVGFESMQISYWKRGWITTYQLKGGSTGVEIRTLYKYNPHYDDWLEVEEVVKWPGERTEIIRPKIPVGIGGKEYSAKENRRKQNSWKE